MPFWNLVFTSVVQTLEVWLSFTQNRAKFKRPIRFWYAQGALNSCDIDLVHDKDALSLWQTYEYRAWYSCFANPTPSFCSLCYYDVQFPSCWKQELCFYVMIKGLRSKMQRISSRARHETQDKSNSLPEACSVNHTTSWPKVELGSFFKPC